MARVIEPDRCTDVNLKTDLLYDHYTSSSIWEKFKYLNDRFTDNVSHSRDSSTGTSVNM